MSPRTSTQNEIIRRQREMEIRETALELFAQRGYLNTSISDIARAVGMSKGLLYNYFKSKDQLLESVLKNAFQMSESIMEPMTDNNIPALDRLRSMITTVFGLYQTHTDYLRLVHSLSLQQNALDQFAEILQGHQVYKMDISIALFTELGSENPMLDALRLGAQLGGVLIHYMHMREQYPLAEMQAAVIKEWVGE
ncbi:MAG: TetR/AcrR family transcriptional regulator [Saprospiraceae bacterium]